MRKKGLQKAFLLSAFFVMLTGYLGAEINWNNGNIITNAGTPGSVWDDTLNLSGTITVSADVYIGARHQDVTVNVTSNNVTLQPMADAANASFGHLIFYAGQDPDTNELRTITVNCDYDLFFTGRYNYTTDFIVTFSGPGQTQFLLSDYNAANVGTANVVYGATVTFTGNSTGVPTYEIRSGGTRVFITMDQTEAQAVTAGNNKVLFKRHHYDDGIIEGDTDTVTGVFVGMGSYITYLSTDYSGTAEWDSGYGTLAFDPTHAGHGRMILRLNRDENSSHTAWSPTTVGSANFHDGGVTVCGHYVPGFSELAIRGSVNLSRTAGKRAIFRVVDDTLYDNWNDPDPNTYDPTDSERRGLLIINENTTVQKLAADPYQEIGLDGGTPNYANFPNGENRYWSEDYSWYNSAVNQYISTANPYLGPGLNVRKGFVLGVNGQMDVYHKTFVEHVSCDYIGLDFFAVQDFSDYSSAGSYYAWNSGSPVFKFRNSSAFVVDGLSNNSTFNPLYTADINARIVLYGDARLLLRQAGGVHANAARDSYLVASSSTYGPFWNNDGEIVYTFSVDSQAYNGDSVPSTALTGADGEPVIEIHGRLGTWGRERYEAPNRGDSTTTKYAAPTYVEKGRINMATLPTDWTAREYSNFNAIETSYIERPLTLNAVYGISNSPNMFFNAIGDFYDVIIDHTDITKPINLDPDHALPAMVGGEAKYFNEQIWGAYSYTAGDAVATFNLYQYPQVRLYGSDVDMHENLIASGLRFEGTERFYAFDDGSTVDGTAANNTSVFRYYDHGDQLDTLLQGHGRVFMLGCSNNVMSDDSSNAVLNSAFVNVYRAKTELTGATPADTIKFSVQSDFDGSLPSLDPIGLERVGKAQHLFLMQRPTEGGSAHMELGWTSTVGYETYLSHNAYPWERVIGNGSTQISLANDVVAPATFSVDGNYIYFDGTDGLFNKAVVPVTSSTQGSVIYTNHGGRFTATQPLSNGAFDASYHGYDCFIDLPMAYKLWTTESLSGVIDLPKDQVKYGYGFGRQVYPLNTNLTSISTGQGAVGTRIRTFNTTSVQNVDGTLQTGRVAKDRHSGEEVVLPWANRSYDSSYVPVKSIYARPELTRYTAIVNQTATIPTDCILFDAGDIVTQLKVAGATIADPLHLLVTGSSDAYGAARVYEIVSIPTSIPESNAHATYIRGEGMHGAIFLQHGGRVGLGARWWNEHSKNAWNILGKDYITICPDGDGIVDVNSDLIVSDPVAVVPTGNFGASTSGSHADATPRLTFYSDDVHEIRVPTGSAFDLSAFGQGNVDRQELALGGKVKLIFEPGSTLRFPTVQTGSPYPVLYLNDESELVFEGGSDDIKGAYLDIRETNSQKINIVGQGRIWVNKDAKISVNGSAMVAVQSDEFTPETDIEISIQRQGDFQIGNEQVAGGAFEVGNPVDLGTGYSVNFALILNGPKARFHIDREGFLGLGVGIVNKGSLVGNAEYFNPNADASSVNNPVIDSTAGTLTWNPSSNAWQVQALHNVHNVSITVQQGIFDHSNIYDGSSNKASLIAIGPITEFEGTQAIYKFEISQDTVRGRSRILGGGNIMQLNALDATYPGKARVNIWDYSDLDSGFRSDGTKYGILGSGPVLMDRVEADFTNSTITFLSGYGIGGGKRFESGYPSELFKFLSYPRYSNLNSKLVNVGFNEFLVNIDYVITGTKYTSIPGDGEIVRRDDVLAIEEGYAEEGLPVGALGSSGEVEPVSLSVIGRG